MSGEVRPLLRVVRGDASAEETAALVAGLALARAAAQRVAATQRRRDGAILSCWCDRARLLGRPVAQGPGAWRASALPN